MWNFSLNMLKRHKNSGGNVALFLGVSKVSSLGSGSSQHHQILGIFGEVWGGNSRSLGWKGVGKSTIWVEEWFSSQLCDRLPEAIFFGTLKDQGDEMKLIPCNSLSNPLQTVHASKPVTFLWRFIVYTPSWLSLICKKIPRWYSIGFAAATLAAAITNPAFLNCKKLGVKCQSLGEVVWWASKG